MMRVEELQLVTQELQGEQGLQAHVQEAVLLTVGVVQTQTLEGAGVLLLIHIYLNFKIIFQQ